MGSARFGTGTLARLMIGYTAPSGPSGGGIDMHLGSAAGCGLPCYLSRQKSGVLSVEVRGFRLALQGPSKFATIVE
jgi:hypothetical protein